MKQIPQITIDFFEEVYIDHVLDTVRITREEFENKLNDTSISSINKKAERFISTYLKNKTDNLTTDNWISAKELFIQWKLFEGIELEKESEDKKNTLLELLELFRDEIIGEQNNKLDLQSMASKIFVIKSDDNVD